MPCPPLYAISLCFYQGRGDAEGANNDCPEHTFYFGPLMIIKNRPFLVHAIEMNASPIRAIPRGMRCVVVVVTAVVRVRVYGGAARLDRLQSTGLHYTARR